MSPEQMPANVTYAIVNLRFTPDSRSYRAGLRPTTPPARTACVGWWSGADPDTLCAMTTTQNMPQVQQCSATSCSYNADSHCQAGAITISGDNAACGTFVEISFRGGSSGGGGLVGACHRADCRYNEKLECTAASVNIGEGADTADCLTYEAR